MPTQAIPVPTLALAVSRSSRNRKISARFVEAGVDSTASLVDEDESSSPQIPRAYVGQIPVVSYRCDVPGCDFEATEDHRIRYHKASHIRPHACNHPGCTYLATTSGSLKRHQMRHVNQKPFKCGYEGCDYECTEGRILFFTKIIYIMSRVIQVSKVSLGGFSYH
jgi:hypothetical protein